MLYPDNIEQKLGFDKIRELLKKECISNLGKGFVDKIRFLNHFDLIDKLTKQTAEFCDILQIDEGFPQHNYIDVTPFFAKVLPENSFLLEEEFFDLKLSLKTIAECINFFKKRPHLYPQLQELSKDLLFEVDLIAEIELIIDNKGQMRADASFELRKIREKLAAAQIQLRKQLERILKSVKVEGFAKEDAQITLREGRFVIPMNAESKRKIKGFVHDESATGQTVYLEPTEVIDMNNEIRELEYAERREIIKILTHLTNKIRPHINNLRDSYRFLGLMDFIRAKAKFAIKTRAINPDFQKKNIINWRNTKHPLLLLHFESQNRTVIPLDITLKDKNRLLVISGPNAGGKSIALKTVGLTQFMYQCGLLVTMDIDSTIGIFNAIFIDMGDEQSLENDLSTYSSHLKSMKHFLDRSDQKTLILIDEFGTGTEPEMGGAMAQSILYELNQAKTFGIVTTHYTNLKHLAEKEEGLINGRMLFDSEKLEPLYQLEIGQAGSSFALEIAQKIGMSKKVMENARKNAGKERVNYDDLLRRLEIETKQYHDKNKLISERESQLKNLTSEYEKLKNYLDTEKKRILNQAKIEAQELIRNANQKIENAVATIKQNQTTKENVKVIRQEIATFSKENLAVEAIPYTPTKEEKEQIEVIGGEIMVGDRVRVKGQPTIGEVVALKGKDVEIMVGELKSIVKLSRLEKINRKIEREVKKEIAKSFLGIDLNEKFMNFSPKIDLRGKRAEEALKKIQDFMDTAILTSVNEITIVHGKGDGILRKLIRDELKKYKAVQSMKDEHADRGGDGVTIVNLK
ncbi:MAG: endonuclease MutS2 [Cytophagia bacterium]|nr:MAG: endonuclease MutS2 [Cytophagia bacterium]TAG43287.1 MAG: endonuclease MutS2 [Cytophagia bacterium]